MSEFVFDLWRFGDGSGIERTLNNAVTSMYNLLTRLGFKEFSEEWEERGPAVLAEWADDNVNPILKFVATFFKR